MDANGRGFVQDGHSYSVAGLAWVSYSLMSPGQINEAGRELQMPRTYSVARLVQSWCACCTTKIPSRCGLL